MVVVSKTLPTQHTLYGATESCAHGAGLAVYGHNVVYGKDFETWGGGKK